MAKEKALTPAEAQQKKGEMLVLLSFLVGAIAVILLMGLISSFLSNNPQDDAQNLKMLLLAGFVGTGALTAVLFILGRRIAHKA